MKAYMKGWVVLAVMLIWSMLALPVLVVLALDTSARDNVDPNRLWDNRVDQVWSFVPNLARRWLGLPIMK